MLRSKANETWTSDVPEAYVALRINLEMSAGGRPPKTVAITSAIRGEGRTTSAFHLAAACAQAGKRTVLVDADLRKPGVHLCIGESNTIGLTHYLMRRSSLKEITKATETKNLSVITSGPAAAHSSDLLSSPEMDALLEELKGEYDAIIIDAPPALGFMDAKIVGAKCDGVLLVVEQGKMKRGLAQRAKEELTRVKAPLLGVVLNKDKSAQAY